MHKKVNPFLHVWAHPRETVRSILTERGFWGVFFIAFLGAWASSLFASVNQDNTATKLYDAPSPFLLILGGIISAVVTLIIGALFSALFYWIAGKILKGKGNYVDLYKGSMLLTFPYFITLPFVLIYIIVYPENFYNVNMDYSVGAGILFIITVLMGAISAIYMFIVTIIMLSEVHQFSKWKAFFTMVLSWVVVFAIVFAFVGIFLGLTQL